MGAGDGLSGALERFGEYKNINRILLPLLHYHVHIYVLPIYLSTGY